MLDSQEAPNERPASSQASQETQDETVIDKTHGLEKSFPLNDEEETVFWTREPPMNVAQAAREGAFYKRRHSITSVSRLHIEADNMGNDSQPEKPDSDRSHLELLDDYQALRDRFKSNHIEKYRLQNGTMMYIIDDFRALRKIKPKSEVSNAWCTQMSGHSTF